MAGARLPPITASIPSRAATTTPTIRAGGSGDVTMWTDAGISHSCVERDAIASIAAQARAAHGLAEPKTLADVVQDAWREDGAARSRQIVLPLRELHRRRGVTIETIEGMRLEVAIKLPA